MNELIKRVIDLAIEIQQIPAPTFEEAKRAEFVCGMFVNEKLTDVFVDERGNVFGRLKAKGRRKPLIVSAHLDTVFPRETNLSGRRQGGKVYGPGIGDNSVGVAALIGLNWLIREENIQPRGANWLVCS